MQYSILIILLSLSINETNAKAGCNPPCKNGGSCVRRKTQSKSFAFKCECLLGLYGVDCTKRVNFCETLDDGVTRINNPCSKHSRLTSCAPTETVVAIPDPHTDLNPTGNILITLAGYACFQTDQIATCKITASSTQPYIFNYVCQTQDNPNYTY